MSDDAILYLHGFNSSPKSEKANETLAYFQKNHPELTVIVPQLSVFPLDAIAQIKQIIEENQRRLKGVIGSSLGGYLATWVAEQYAIKAVLINPAVRPFELLEGLLGEQTNPYTGQNYLLKAEHMSQIKSVDTPMVHYPERIWLLAQMGDEVLDYREAEAKYSQCKQTIETGGDHRFVGYDKYLPDIVKFFQIA